MRQSCKIFDLEVRKFGLRLRFILWFVIIWQSFRKAITFRKKVILLVNSLNLRVLITTKVFDKIVIGRLFQCSLNEPVLSHELSLGSYRGQQVVESLWVDWGWLHHLNTLKMTFTVRKVLYLCDVLIFHSHSDSSSRRYWHGCRV